ncbi:hypothetical protein Cgig2_018109 [Carnegiea gigantea]|uniref:DUF3456 domain-containing protein n=1 Tax=Carnegiea gigantea TaxID=171969 RepID=A0A9Q1JY42_9CARY|nr:hypothetical protein Cgig2_018109 [Carnegiea gigantea]
MADSWLRLATIVVLFAVATSIDDKCAACNAVAEELERGLANEKPRNHLDLRNRLDSKGQRQGKRLDILQTFAFYLHLLSVEQYDAKSFDIQISVLQTASETQEWIRVQNWDNLTIRSSGVTCVHALLHIHALILAELIKNGSVKPGGVGKVLCEDLSKHCRRTSGSQKEADGSDDDDDDPKDEL